MKKTFGYIACYILGLFTTAGVYGVVYVTPMSYWLTYHAMVIDGDQCIGEFETDSFASFNRPVDIDYVDVLRCRAIGATDYKNVDSQLFSIKNHYPPALDSTAEDTIYSDEPVYKSPWSYTKGMPSEESYCYVRGTQEITVLFGIKKQSTVDTNEVMFSECK